MGRIGKLYTFSHWEESLKLNIPTTHTHPSPDLHSQGKATENLKDNFDRVIFRHLRELISHKRRHFSSFLQMINQNINYWSRFVSCKDNCVEEKNQQIQLNNSIWLNFHPLNLILWICLMFGHGLDVDCLLYIFVSLTPPPSDFCQPSTFHLCQYFLFSNQTISTNVCERVYVFCLFPIWHIFWFEIFTTRTLKGTDNIDAKSKNTKNWLAILIKWLHTDNIPDICNLFYTGKIFKSQIYTQRKTKNNPWKSILYAVFAFNLENFTPDRIFLHGHRPWCP